LEELLKSDDKGLSNATNDSISAHDSFSDAPAIKAELQRLQVKEREVTKKADTKIRGQFVETRASFVVSS
jgi:hypothetical protein